MNNRDFSWIVPDIWTAYNSNYYTMAAKDPKQQNFGFLGVYLHSPAWGSRVWGSTVWASTVWDSTGWEATVLGCLSISDLAEHLLDWESTV